MDYRLTRILFDRRNRSPLSGQVLVDTLVVLREMPQPEAGIAAVVTAIDDLNGSLVRRAKIVVPSGAGFGVNTLNGPADLRRDQFYNYLMLCLLPYECVSGCTSPRWCTHNTGTVLQDELTRAISTLNRRFAEAERPA